MKKLLFISVLMIMSFTSLKAQEGFNLGVHIGIPVGDVSSLSSFNFGADLAYLFKAGDSFDVGIATGYTSFKMKTFMGISLGSVDFIPIAATFRYAISDKYFMSADLGYGIMTNAGGDGGFYYQPKFGMRTGKSDIFAFYKGISKNGGTFASLGIGIAFSFK